MLASMTCPDEVCAAMQDGRGPYTDGCRQMHACVHHCGAQHVQLQRRCLGCVCCSPNVRVRVSLGGTSPKLLAMALDILGAVVPCPAPGPSSSPKSAEGAPERVLPAVGDGKLPAGQNLFQSSFNVWFPSML